MSAPPALGNLLVVGGRPQPTDQIFGIGGFLPGGSLGPPEDSCFAAALCTSVIAPRLGPQTQVPHARREPENHAPDPSSRRTDPTVQKLGKGPALLVPEPLGRTSPGSRRARPAGPQPACCIQPRSEAADRGAWAACRRGGPLRRVGVSTATHSGLSWELLGRGSGKTPEWVRAGWRPTGGKGPTLLHPFHFIAAGQTDGHCTDTPLRGPRCHTPASGLTPTLMARAATVRSSPGVGRTGPGRGVLVCAGPAVPQAPRPLPSPAHILPVKWPHVPEHPSTLPPPLCTPAASPGPSLGAGTCPRQPTWLPKARLGVTESGGGGGLVRALPPPHLAQHGGGGGGGCW